MCLITIWFVQGQQHGKSLPISSWDAAEEVVASAIYGSGYYISLKFSIMSNVSLPSNIYAVRNTWNWRSSVGSEGCSALSRSKESFKRALLSKIIPETHPPSLPPSERFIDWCFRGQSVRRGSSFPPALPCTEERRFHSRVKRFHGIVVLLTGQHIDAK